MTKTHADGILSNRLSDDDYQKNFADLHPPLSPHEALVAADRCYFCYDAPCTRACPTEIDIPLFIRQIATGNTQGAAKTIFDQNIFGGMCARVCPTETLCEEACVREAAEGKPVNIGLLQRHATDRAMVENRQFYQRAPSSGKTVAVVGAGPAGIACAHRLAMYGHDVIVFEAQDKSGGLNEYGIAAYKTPNNFAQAEMDYILAIGGIRIEYNKPLGGGVSLQNLRDEYDAVFLACGLSGVRSIGVEGEDSDGAMDAVRFISDLRQTEQLAALPVGRRVVVIGGGMTAIDAAVQSKLLGAEEVTVCYRGEQARMKASQYEQDLAAQKGVLIRHGLSPKRFVRDDNGRVCAVEFAYTGGEQSITLQADQVLKAVGQKLAADAVTQPKIENNKICVDEHGRTSVDGVWAGGDCASGGDDLTVSAVAMGRDAAEDIHKQLRTET